MPQESEKRLWYLKTLYEASQELNAHIQPKKIMDAFLLTAMGALGLTSAFAMLINTSARTGTLSNRGLTDAGIRQTEDNLPAICERFFSWTKAAAPRPLTIDREAEIVAHSLFPAGTHRLILWRGEDPFCGLLGFGKTITGLELDRDGAELLNGLADILIGAMSHALTTQQIQQLNADLGKKNRSLTSALGEARETREILDRNLLHLSGLNDLNAELCRISETRPLVEAFLLTTMGTFSAASGVAIVHDRQDGTVCTVARGVDPAPQLDAAAFETLYLSALAVCDDKTMAPMSVTRIHRPAIFSECGFGMDAREALAFVVDEALLGFVALGPTITGAPMPEAEAGLLPTSLSTFMVYCRNVRAYEAIRALNRDLAQRNAALEAAVRDLTAANQKIDLLEKAKAHIKALVHRELQRTGRASALDYLLIAAFALVVGVLYNFSSPNGIALLPESMTSPPSPRIQASEARSLVNAGGALVVDARPRALYEAGRISGAVNLTPAVFDLVYLMNLGGMDLDRPIIVYGRTVSRRYDQEVAMRLRQRDHETVVVLEGGLAAWERQGFAVER